LQSFTGSAMSLKTIIEATCQELAETRQQLAQVSGELERTRELARTDPLTGLGNRRAMTELLRREVAGSHRTGAVFSIAVLDVDHFKRINDEFGHFVGDDVLSHLGKVAKSCIRDTDTLFRHGGEEFMVSLPGAAAEGAHFVIDRMRSQMERTPLLVEQK